jgi:hypothetical protein
MPCPFGLVRIAHFALMHSNGHALDSGRPSSLWLATLQGRFGGLAKRVGYRMDTACFTSRKNSLP